MQMRRTDGAPRRTVLAVSRSEQQLPERSLQLRSGEVVHRGLAEERRPIRSADQQRIVV
jgi:hypothetical protein